MHETHYNLALSLAYQGRLRDSIEHFVSARRINPRSPDFQKTLFPILVTLLQQGEGQPVRWKALPLLAERPLVSVVMPTFNRPQMLRDALASVSRQTYGNWEAIVVNDGGCDISSVLDAMPREVEAKVRRASLPTSRGPAAARNLAI